jgi:hypothetical protein
LPYLTDGHEEPRQVRHRVESQARPPVDPFARPTSVTARVEANPGRCRGRW